MRLSGLLLALPLVLIASACGGASSSGSASGVGSEPSSTQKQQNLPESDASPRAPELVLKSRAGSQAAIRGSSCFSGPGVGACLDGAYPRPKKLSIVRPGEMITISLEDAHVVRAENCGGGREQDCIGAIKVHPFGCEKLVSYTISLEPGKATRWKVALPPGPYELETFAYFESDDGQMSGDVSGGFGLYVDSSRSLGVVSAPVLDQAAC